MKEAAEAFTQAVRIDPKYEAALKDLSKVYAELEILGEEVRKPVAVKEEKSTMSRKGIFFTSGPKGVIKTPGIGEMIPDFTLPNGFKSGYTSFNDDIKAKSRVIALLFTATDSKTGKDELALLSDLSKKYGDDFMAYAIFTDINGVKLVPEFDRKYGYDARLLLDPDFKTPLLFGFDYTPALVLSEGDGRIVYLKAGYDKNSHDPDSIIKATKDILAKKQKGYSIDRSSVVGMYKGPPLRVGDTLPDFSLPDGISGQKVYFDEDIRGMSKVIALLFIVTGDSAGKAEVGLMSDLANKYGDDFKVYVVAVDLGGRNTVPAFDKAYGFNVRYLLDPDYFIPNMFGFTYTPSLVIMDRYGNITFLKGGYSAGRDPDSIIQAVKDGLR